MAILGISAFYHDSAAAVVHRGEILAAAQEERFTRIKHDSGFPEQAISECLKSAGLSPSDITHVVFYDKPLLKFERLLDTFFNVAPSGFNMFRKAMPVWLREKLFTREIIYRRLKKNGWSSLKPEDILFSEHHLSHAASAFYPSGFEEAAILTIDGVGEWATASIAHGRGAEIKVLKELHFPHSPGLLYSAFTAYCGFKVNSGEYKLMGLAPYGKPVFVETILRHIVDIRDDGSIRLNMEYFGYMDQMRMTTPRLHQLLGEPPRKPGEPLTDFHRNLAASIQLITEEMVMKMAAYAMKITGSRRLCMAGGVALNCVANGRILRELKPEGFWIQPAAGDAGGAAGAALAFEYYDKTVDTDRLSVKMEHAFLGNEFTSDEIRNELQKEAAVFREMSSVDMIEFAAQQLAKGAVMGWFQGRMEFGPRALGHRSILAHPGGKDTQKNINLKIKFRESFRPFAPVVTEEKAPEFFNEISSSPFMLFTFQVADKRVWETIPAVIHVDGSARVQTVGKKENPLLHKLISAFEIKTGIPVLVNTSFNVRGEPVVCRPSEAYHGFMSTDMDVLVIGNFVLLKNEQLQNSPRKPRIAED